MFSLPHLLSVLDGSMPIFFAGFVSVTNKCNSIQLAKSIEYIVKLWYNLNVTYVIYQPLKNTFLTKRSISMKSEYYLLFVGEKK